MRLTKGQQSANLHLVIDTAGAAYPLTVDPLLHGQAAKLTASDAEDEDQFGYSVAISGDTVVVGALSGRRRGGAPTAGRPMSLSATRMGVRIAGAR